MRSGQLNRRLVLEAATRMPDGAGGFSEIWGARGHVWAAVRPRGAGREVDQAARLQLSIQIRAVPQDAGARPLPGMRFRDCQRLYWIDAVQESDPSGRFLICFAHEEVGR